jgi:hypothetical protein
LNTASPTSRGAAATKTTATAAKTAPTGSTMMAAIVPVAIKATHAKAPQKDQGKKENDPPGW